jgi:hypothetical protein
MTCMTWQCSRVKLLHKKISNGITVIIMLVIIITNYIAKVPLHLPVNLIIKTSPWNLLLLNSEKFNNWIKVLRYHVVESRFTPRQSRSEDCSSDHYALLQIQWICVMLYWNLMMYDEYWKWKLIPHMLSTV